MEHLKLVVRDGATTRGPELDRSAGRRPPRDARARRVRVPVADRVRVPGAAAGDQLRAARGAGADDLGARRFQPRRRMGATAGATSATAGDRSGPVSAAAVRRAASDLPGAPGTDPAVAAAEDRAPLTGYRPGLLLFATAFGALSGIVYELLLASLASYLLGLPVLVFSLTVGGFLASMGVGAYLSRFVDCGLLPTFLRLELLLALFGGALPLALFAVYAVDGPYLPLHALGTAAIGVLTGIELPLITRMLERAGGLRSRISRVLALDYAGRAGRQRAVPAGAAAVRGVDRRGRADGRDGALVVAVVAWGHRRTFDAGRRLAFAGLAAAVVRSPPPGPPAASRTRWRNASTRRRSWRASRPRTSASSSPGAATTSACSSTAICSSALSTSTATTRRWCTPRFPSRRPARVLLLGAGDGLALREILKYPAVREVVVIELDREMISLATRHPTLVRLNGNSFSDARAAGGRGRRVRGAARGEGASGPAVRRHHRRLPGPRHRRRRAGSTARRSSAGRAVCWRAAACSSPSSSSPFFAPDAFFCVARTMADAGLVVRSYTVDVPVRALGVSSGRGRAPRPIRRACTSPCRRAT